MEGRFSSCRQAREESSFHHSISVNAGKHALKVVAVKNRHLESAKGRIATRGTVSIRPEAVTQCLCLSLVETTSPFIAQLPVDKWYDFYR